MVGGLAGGAEEAAGGRAVSAWQRRAMARVKHSIVQVWLPTGLDLAAKPASPVASRPALQIGIALRLSMP